MLYSKKDEKKLDMALFRNPTKEYRAAPFWSWNGKLIPEILELIDANKIALRPAVELSYLAEEEVRYSQAP